MYEKAINSPNKGLQLYCVFFKFLVIGEFDERSCL